MNDPSSIFVDRYEPSFLIRHGEISTLLKIRKSVHLAQNEGSTCDAVVSDFEFHRSGRWNVRFIPPAPDDLFGAIGRHRARSNSDASVVGRRLSFHKAVGSKGTSNQPGVADFGTQRPYVGT
jgi:hypothetical protein